jgi:hypothetical protein
MATTTQHSGAISDLADCREWISTITSPRGAELIEPENRTPVLQELEDVCSDPEFQSSQRNCEFLRFVVLESQNGRGHELRERTLGVELFGRSDTYDTGADAVVRVRENDVRKPLIRHYEKASPKTGWQITLPPRSYQAVFMRHIPRQEDPVNASFGTLAIPQEIEIAQDPRHLTPIAYTNAIRSCRLRHDVPVAGSGQQSLYDVLVDTACRKIKRGPDRGLRPQ